MPKSPQSFDALRVNEAPFGRIVEFTTSKRLLTSWYDHGRGINRQYTLKYCLQSNYHQNPRKFYIKRGGRQPPELWYASRVPKHVKLCELFEWAAAHKAQVLATLDADTPSYDSLYNNIVRKYPQEVVCTYSKTPSSGCDLGVADAAQSRVE